MMTVLRRAWKIIVTRQGTVCLLIAAVMLLCACGGSRDRVNTLYAQRCLGCHGTSGRGDGPLASNLPVAVSDFRETVTRKSVPQIRNVIASGEGVMPAFGPALSNGEIEDMVQLVHTLSREGRTLAWWEKIESLNWAHCNVPWEFVLGYSQSNDDKDKK